MDKFDQKIVTMYRDEQKSTYQIAEALDTYAKKIERTLKKHGVELRSKSDAQKLALENGVSVHPTAGKERSVEDRVKISASLVDYWDNMTKKERAKRVKMAKDNWKNMSAEAKETMRQRGIAAIRAAASEGSKLEKFFYERLTENGHKVRQHEVIIPAENLEIDLYIPALKTIIEVDGPSHFYPIWGDEKLQKQINADLRKSGSLMSRGYAIIRVKSHGNESLSKRESLIEQVLTHLCEIGDQFPPKSKRFIEVE